MKHRPWPLVVIALLHFFSPIVNFFGSAYLMKVSPSEYLSMLMGDGFLSLFEFFALLPLAGFAIYKVRPWSYPVFLMIVGWEFFSNFRTYKIFPEYFGFPLLLFVTLVNIGIVSYLLKPTVREIYFNRRLRWWETKPRFAVNYTGTMKVENKDIACKVKDLSEGGAFIQADQTSFKQDDRALLMFDADGKMFQVNALVVHRLHYEDDQVAGYGLQFTMERSERKLLKALIKTFDKTQAKNRNESLSLSSFKEWVSSFIK